MPEPTRDQLLSALRKADAAGDTEAARAIARRIASMDAASGEGLDMSSAPITDESPLRQLGTSTQNTLAGLAQGVAETVIDFPLEIASGVGRGVNYALSEGGGAALDALGFDNAADAVRSAGQRSRAMQNNWQRSADLIEQISPTPEGYEASRFASRLAGSFAVPFGPKAAPRNPPRLPQANPRGNPRVNPDAAQIVAEGQRRRVPVMTTDVKPPRTAPGRFIKQTIPEKIPFAGTSGPRLAQQDARQRAVVEAVQEFGGDTARALFDDADTLAQQIAKDFAAKRSKKLKNLKTAKDSVINSIDDLFTEAPNAVRAINGQIERLRGIDSEAFAPVIQRLLQFRKNLTSGKTLEQIEGQRRLLGDLFEDASLATIRGDGQKAIRAIYDPLRKDMGAFIEATAGRTARLKWERANNELSAMAGELASATFRNVLKQSDTNPETISRILFGNAENTSDITRLVKNLDDDGVRKVQGALLTRAFDRAAGHDGVSVERFLNNLQQLSGKIGVAFKGEDRAALEGLRKLLESTRRAAEAGANIRTGEQNVPTILGIGAIQALGATAGISTLGVGGLIARLYESAPVRNLLIGLSKSNSAAKDSRFIARIMRTSVPIVNNWRDDIARVANDNVGVAAAAEEPSQ